MGHKAAGSLRRTFTIHNLLVILHIQLYIAMKAFLFILLLGCSVSKKLDMTNNSPNRKNNENKDEEKGENNAAQLHQGSCGHFTVHIPSCDNISRRACRCINSMW